jgi:hypothetical protein
MTLEQTLLQMLSGGTDSPIAIAVGCAEGTRTPDGRLTANYYAHFDPGNRARNQGSFSYQGEASSAKDADLKQIEKLKKSLLPQFLHLFKDDTTEARALWAIACDCFTQSEAACLALDGFLDRISTDDFEYSVEAIIEARYQAYFDPSTGKLDAPGFGNRPERLRADQERRTIAVLEAIA